MELSYLGGVLNTELLGYSEPGEARWSWNNAATRSFLDQRGEGCFQANWESLAILIRGYARPTGSTGRLDLERVAEEIRCRYLERGQLDIEDLEGCFTIALLDGQAGRVLLYRNLVGTGFTYYHVGRTGFRFGSNLADLVDAAMETPRPNSTALPAFFLYRCVPGAETLFDGFFRLLPGEEVEWSARGLRRRQRQTFASLRTSPIDDAKALGHLEQTMARVIADCVTHRPLTANLLSGGVDSSYLQAVWNRVAVGPNELPPSFSISVDHPRSWADTDYAMTASRGLGTTHTLVPADGPYDEYLIQTLAATGEPPNHVQSAYFGLLARKMAGAGMQAGLCGEGADSLFGLGMAHEFHRAARLRRYVPMASVRSWLGSLGGVLRWNSLSSAAWLSNAHEDYEDLEHPVNRVAAFTQWDLASECFGPRALENAAARRRDLLDQFGLTADPLDRLHAAGFLGEAMDSASLWTTLFQREGVDMLCPFLDSRMVSLGLNLSPRLRYGERRPKELLKRALARHLPANLVYRGKLGFGQPIFEWLAPDGQLRSRVEEMEVPDFIERPTWHKALQRPGWFLYSLLVYDTWHRLFIERSLPRGSRRFDSQSLRRSSV